VRTLMFDEMEMVFWVKYLERFHLTTNFSKKEVDVRSLDSRETNLLETV